ncbi:LpqB family beta-propeller domain-containing protein [Microbulbifer sp.]|uniref:LpqB family beta-propeller domain-containing protein n=1 Tax=Microbulbifer sp. TaxID=1908541 RepID=UPI003F35123B
MSESGEVRKITDNIRWRDMDTDVSADGRLVFSSNREDNPRVDLNRISEDFNIHLIEKDGSEPKKIASSRHRELKPRFSPGGRNIAVIRSGARQQLLVVGANGEGERALAEADEIYDFSWSPDGRRIALARRDGKESGIWLVSADGSEPPFQLKNVSRAHRIVSIRWSPDGGKIAYIDHPLNAESRQLWVRHLDSGRDQRISPEDLQVQQPPEWSADGNRLLYAALADYRFRYDENAHKKVYEGAMHIYLSDLEGNDRQLTSREALHKSPVFSPDGRRIAFLYAPELNSRQLSLRTMDRDGGNVNEWFDSVARNSNLRWVQ